MEHVKEIIRIKNDLEAKLEKLNYMLDDSVFINIGDHRGVVNFSSCDEDIRDLINLKINKLRQQLAPIDNKINMINALALEALDGDGHELGEKA